MTHPWKNDSLAPTAAFEGTVTFFLLPLLPKEAAVSLTASAGSKVMGARRQTASAATFLQECTSRQSLHTLTSIRSLSHSERCAATCHWDSIFRISLMANETKHLFMCLFVTFFMKCLLIFCPFSNWMTCVFTVEFWDTEISVLCHGIYKHFLPVHSKSVQPLHKGLHRTKIFNFYEAQMIHFSFCVPYFFRYLGIKSKKSLPTSRF